MKTGEDWRKGESRRKNNIKRLEETLFNPCTYTI
jgi:hypothetical protein